MPENIHEKLRELLNVHSMGCPHDAIRMERCADVPEPPANTMEMGMRLMQEKGKLEEFIKLNTL
jgi:hypothetical protein